MSKKSNRNEPSIIELAAEAIYIQENRQKDLSLARSYLAQIYSSINRFPGQLKKVTNYSLICKAFIMMLKQQVSDDLEVLRKISCLGYFFASKAIKEKPDNSNLYKYRLVVLRFGHDSLIYPVMSALELIPEDIYLQGDYYINARDAIYRMEIYDLKRNPILYKKIHFFKQRKAEFDDMMDREFFLPETTYKEVVKTGKKNHKKLFRYIEKKAIENKDIDF